MAMQIPENNDRFKPPNAIKNPPIKSKTDDMKNKYRSLALKNKLKKTPHQLHMAHKAHVAHLQHLKNKK